MRCTVFTQLSTTTVSAVIAINISNGKCWSARNKFYTNFGRLHIFLCVRIFLFPFSKHVSVHSYLASNPFLPNRPPWNRYAPAYSVVDNTNAWNVTGEVIAEGKTKAYKSTFPILTEYSDDLRRATKKLSTISIDAMMHRYFVFIEILHCKQTWLFEKSIGMP